jgi:uncharacterized protein YecT (DUF1311 family)
MKTLRMACKQTLFRCKQFFVIFGCLLWVSQVQAASFDCAKVSTKVEKMICKDKRLALQQLDEELAKAYADALDASSQPDLLRKDQQAWLKTRNACQDDVCISDKYEHRIHVLLPLGKAARDAKPDVPHGKYVLRVSKGELPENDYAEDYEFCRTFVDNLNEFGNLDFDDCNPRLSPKYPQFSRPQWEEIQLDLKLAANILSTQMPFNNWLSETQAARDSGQVKMWRLQADIFGDGDKETVVKLDHTGDGSEGAYCSQFNSMQLFTKIPYTANHEFYTGLYARYRFGNDMIYDSKSKHYYQIAWNPWTAISGSGKPLEFIGAIAGLLVNRANNQSVNTICWVDWVPAGLIKR